LEPARTQSRSEKQEAGPEGPAPIAIQSTLIESEGLSDYELTLDLRHRGVRGFEGSAHCVGGGTALVAGVTQSGGTRQAECLAPGGVTVVELENDESQSLSRSH
jgi:hypothetical protein